MVAGGAEELSVALLFLFDSMYATSACHDAVPLAPRPFDSSRDGLVIGEGACSLVLEERSFAESRGARIYAEIVGFGTNSDGAHITAPTPETMRAAVQLSLRDADLDPEQIGFIHAHATGTTLGDSAEASAMAPLFGDRAPVGALKGNFGHTLGACGALEAAMTIRMMREERFLPIANLTSVDPKCAGLDLIQGQARSYSCDFAMSNNFAFGGVNTSLIFRRL
jgi:3-oxoacyl-[acyl-carrier-protein] synthase II